MEEFKTNSITSTMYDIEEKPFAHGSHVTVHRGFLKEEYKAAAATATPRLPSKIALKKIDLSNKDLSSKSRLIKNYENEVACMKRINEHCGLSQDSHCISMYFYEKRENECIIGMELMDGDLKDLIKALNDATSDIDLTKHGFKLDVNLIKHIGNECMKGLTELERCGILHCDIKEENIFYKWDKTNNKILIKFGDFGGSLFLRDDNGNEVKHGAYSMECYTPEHLPPECVRHVRHKYADKFENEGDSLDYKVDVWGIGCVLYALVFDSIPFDMPERLDNDKESYSQRRMNELYYNIINSKFTIKDWQSKQCQYNLLLNDDSDTGEIEKLLDFIDWCLAYNQAQRPTASKLLLHGLFDSTKAFKRVMQTRPRKVSPRVKKLTVVNDNKCGLVRQGATRDLGLNGSKQTKLTRSGAYRNLNDIIFASDESSDESNSESENGNENDSFYSRGALKRDSFIETDRMSTTATTDSVTISDLDSMSSLSYGNGGSDAYDDSNKIPLFAPMTIGSNNDNDNNNKDNSESKEASVASVAPLLSMNMSMGIVPKGVKCDNRNGSYSRQGSLTSMRSSRSSHGSYGYGSYSHCSWNSVSGLSRMSSIGSVHSNNQTKNNKMKKFKAERSKTNENNKKRKGQSKERVGLCEYYSNQSPNYRGTWGKYNSMRFRRRDDSKSKRMVNRNKEIIDIYSIPTEEQKMEDEKELLQLKAVHDSFFDENGNFIRPIEEYGKFVARTDSRIFDQILSIANCKSN